MCVPCHFNGSARLLRQFCLVSQAAHATHNLHTRCNPMLLLPQQVYLLWTCLSLHLLHLQHSLCCGKFEGACGAFEGVCCKMQDQGIIQHLGPCRDCATLVQHPGCTRHSKGCTCGAQGRRDGACCAQLPVGSEQRLELLCLQLPVDTDVDREALGQQHAAVQFLK